MLSILHHYTAPNDNVNCDINDFLNAPGIGCEHTGIIVLGFMALGFIAFGLIPMQTHRSLALICLLFTWAILFVNTSSAEENRVTFPTNIDKLVHYTTVTRSEVE